jgi:lipopolysaccharide export system protein LptA
LEVRSSDNRAHAQDGVLVVDQARNLTLTAQELDYQENLYNATAKGKVCVDSQDERGQPFRICSERLDWNVRQKLMHAQGKVRVTYAGTTATAEDLDYRQDAQIAVLKPGAGAKSPRPTISQADSVILGDELTLHLRERMYEAKGSAWGKIILRAKEQP